jgi:hypothetical protein
MEPYGRRQKLKANLVDNHPPKGHVNWWEVEFDDVTKKRARRQGKKEIEKEKE